MKQYTVTGMNCAACSARVEKAVLKVEGVTSCSVSLLTNSMAVDGTASPASIIKAVKDAGYGAKEKGNEVLPRVTGTAYKADDFYDIDRRRCQLFLSLRTFCEG